MEQLCLLVLHPSYSKQLTEATAKIEYMTSELLAKAKIRRMIRDGTLLEYCARLQEHMSVQFAGKITTTSDLNKSKSEDD